MKQGPRRILATLGASAAALCASVALATPALADTLEFGDLVFTSPDTIDEIVTRTSSEDGETSIVTVAGGTAETSITVTLAEDEDVTDPVSQVVIGGTTADYPGDIEFTGIKTEGASPAPHALSIKVANATSTCNVTIDDCNLIGYETDQPTILVQRASDGTTLSLGDSTIQGAPGINGSQEQAATAVSILSKATLVVSGMTVVEGGTGGDAANASVAPGAGGFGVYAPQSTLTMTNGTLIANAGDYGEGSEIEPNDLPVGLTVASYNLSRAVGASEGPTVQAYGWPQENSQPLDLSGIQVGSREDGTFYPWMLRVSVDEENPGSNPYVVAFAGSNQDDASIPREGWRWFEISPAEVTGLKVEAVGNIEDSDGELYEQHEIWKCANPFIGEAQFMYKPIVMATFGIEGVEDWMSIAGSTIPQNVIDPNAVDWHDVSSPEYGTGQWFSLKPGYSGNQLSVSGSVTLPEEFTALYPGLSNTVDNTIDIVNVKAVYRLYNQWTGCHLYTTDTTEVSQCINDGWNNEHAYWYAPDAPAQGDSVVRRLFNPYNGDHYYIESTNTEGIAYLKSLGWEEDSSNADIVSLPDDGVNMPIYTLFNPFAQMDTHLYTPLQSEVDARLDEDWELNKTILFGYPFYNVAFLGM